VTDRQILLTIFILGEVIDPRQYPYVAN